MRVIADGRVVIDVILDDGRVAKGVANVDRSLGGLRKSGERAAFGIGKIVTALGLVYAARKGINLLRDALHGAFDRIDTMEQFERVMGVMVDDTSAVSGSMDRLQDIVRGTAMRTDNMTSAIQGFVTRGLEIDKATDHVEAWGNAVAFYGDGSNQQFQNVTDALHNMVSKGTVGMDQLNRITQAGIPAVELYADATGEASEDVQSALSAGEISAEEFVDVVSTAMMEGSEKFPEISSAMRDEGTSWGSIMENIGAYVELGVTDIVTAIDDMLEDNGLPDMRTMIDEFAQGFGSALSSIAEKIPDVVDWIKNVYDTLEPWIPLIKVLAVTIGTFVAALATLNTAIRVAQAVWAAFNLVLMANPIVLIIAAVVALAAAIYFYWDEIKEFTIFTWNAIKEFFVTYWEAIKALFTSAFDWIDDKTGGAFSAYFELVKRYMGMAWENIKAVWDWVKNTFKNVLDFLKALVSGDFEGMKRAIQNQMENSRKMVSNILGNIRKYFGDILGKIFNNVRNRFNDMRNAIRSVFNNIRNSITNSINNVRTAISSGINRALNVVLNIGRSFYNAGRNIITNIANGIRSAISSVTSAISSVTSRIRNFLPFSPAKDGPLKDIDKLDFGGTIADSIDKGKRKAMQAMGGMAETLSNEISPEVSLRGKSINDVLGNLMPTAVTAGATGTVERTKREDDERVIVVQPNDIYLDGREVSRGTAKYDNEQFGNISARQRRMSFGRKRV